MVFRIESSSCLSVVLSHLIALQWGWTQFQKAQACSPPFLQCCFPYNNRPSSELPDGFPLSSRVPGNQGQGPKKPAPCSYQCRALPWEAGQAASAPHAAGTLCCMRGARCLPPLGSIKRREGERNNNIFTLTVTRIQFHISLIIVLSC